MNKILTLLFLVLPLLTNAQTLKKADIFGTWTVVDGKTISAELPADVKQKMAVMIDGFKESKWTFNENGIFRIKFKENLSPVLKEIVFLDNKLWKFNEAISEIRVGTKDDNYNHLVITATRINTGINFSFSDIPIYLTLKKE